MRLLFFAVLSFYSSLFAQNFKSFKKLSRPEKYWVIFHPFVAKETYKITKYALQITQEIKKQKMLDTLENGGQLDAFRHAYWMAILTHNIGAKKAWKLGKAHEKGNYIDFKKGQYEEGFIPDSISVSMDLFNNKLGIEIGKSYNCSQIKNVVIEYVLSGKMKIIFRNKNYDFLDCSGNIISNANWQGVWKNNRCLVNSNILE